MGEFQLVSEITSNRFAHILPRHSPIGWFAAGLFGLSTCLALFAAAFFEWRGAWWELALLALLAVLAEAQPVRISSNTEISASVLPILFAAVVYGPLPAMLVGAIALSRDFGAPHTRWLIWTCLRALAGGLAGVAALVILSLGAKSPILLLSAAAAAAITEAVVDVMLGAAVVSIRGSGTLGSYFRSVRPVLLATAPLYTPVIAVLAIAYDRVSVWSVLLFFGPAFAAHRFYRLYQEEREATDKLEGANQRLERATISFATALVATLDARDRYTAGHSAAVAIYARDIAARLGLTEDEQRRAHLAGLVHDIGKVGLAPGLLEKQGPLTLEERRQMESHCTIGERILAKVEDYDEIARIVRSHHERVDGNGYPDGLHGDEIPLISRIIAAADAYNAMTSDRPYRDAMPSRVARMRMAQAVESQFDTAVVAAFEAVLTGASETYRTGLGPDFKLVVQSQRIPSPDLVAAASG